MGRNVLYQFFYLLGIILMVGIQVSSSNFGDKPVKGDHNVLWVRLFRVALDGSNSDHLTSLSTGRFAGSGLGISPSA